METVSLLIMLICHFEDIEEDFVVVIVMMCYFN